MAGAFSGMTAEQWHNIRTRLEMSKIIQTLTKVDLDHGGLRLSNQELDKEIARVRAEEDALGGCDWCQSMRGVVYPA